MIMTKFQPSLCGLNRPQSRALGGFLGPTGYSRKFVRNYRLIAAPLTDILRKNVFVWSAAAFDAFAKLKLTLTTKPALALPDFSISFVVECDASEDGLGTVLQQNGRPIAFFSLQLALRHKKFPAYASELIGLSIIGIHISGAIHLSFAQITIV